MKKIILMIVLAGMTIVSAVDKSVIDVGGTKSYISSIPPVASDDSNMTIAEKRSALAKFLNPKINFLPVNAMPIDTYSEFNLSTKSYQDKMFNELNNSDLIKKLPVQSSSVKMYKLDESSTFLIPVAGASFAQSVGRYNVIMDYMKYRIEPLHDLNETFYGYAKIGVGMRIIANLKTNKADVNLGSLLAIGASASAGDISGDISVEIIGIDSPDVTNLIPLTSTIDQTSIQSALQALASIKTKLNDLDMEITPHIVAYQDINKEIKDCNETKKCRFCFWRK